MADHAGETDWRAVCDCLWPLALCLWASGFGGAGLRPGGSPSSSGVVFRVLLVDVPALCPVHWHLSVPAHWQWRRRRPAQCGGSRDHRIWRRRRRQWPRAAVRRAAAAAFSHQRGCVAARWGSILGQRLPRLLQRWWDCPCHWVTISSWVWCTRIRFTTGIKDRSLLIAACTWWFFL